LKGKNEIGINEATKNVFLFRLWTVFSGLVVLISVPLNLSSSEQGYYFLFVSILALQVFFELGLNQALIQFVTHEYYKNLEKLKVTIQFFKNIYKYIAIMYVVSLVVGGLIFFKNDAFFFEKNYYLIYLILILLNGFNIYQNINLCFHDSCNRMEHSYRHRLIQSLIGNILLIVMLYCGMGLWSFIALPLSSVFLSSIWLRKNKLTYDVEGPIKVNYKKIAKEILPFQWRIAVSWISGYLVFQLFVPMTYKQYGAIEAGKLGLTMAAFNAMLSVVMGITSAKNPDIIKNIVQGDKKKLMKILIKLISITGLLVLIFSIIIITIIFYGQENNINFIKRFLDPKITLIIGIITVINSVIFNLASFMRAHREEPMMLQSLTMGILTAIDIYFCMEKGILTVLVVYLIITIAIALPWTVINFIKYKNRTYET
jgi:O-antigen/teichoic acid export membrane protein